MPPTENTWSYSQKLSLSIATKWSATLSIIGSCYIIQHNLKPDSQRSERLNNVYNRLLLVLSICDLMISSASFASTWAMPVDDPQTFLIHNKGNQTTCDLQGFFIQFGGFSVALYNACLCLYFLLSTRYSISNAKIKRFYEPLFHIISLGFPFSVGVFSVMNDFMNPTPSVCWIAEKPRGCIGDECIRGKDYLKVRLYGCFVPILLSMITIVVSMTMLYTHVRRLEDAVHSYSSRWTRKLSGRQSKRVFRQAMLYIGAFALVWVTYMIQICLVKVYAGDSAIAYWTLFVVQILCPLQGFFNALIYARLNPIVEIVSWARSSFKSLRRRFSSLTTRNDSGAETHQNQPAANVQTDEVDGGVAETETEAQL